MPEKGIPAATLEEAAKLLMIDQPSLPADADQSAMLPLPTPTPTSTPDSSVPSVVKVNQFTKTSTTPATTEEEETEPEISPEERKRRSFQAEAEKTKAKLAKLEADMEAQTATLNQQLALEAEKNKMLMNMLSGVTALRGGEEPKPVNGKPKTDKEPELSDFINLEEYDREEALDPRTASGQAWVRYNRALQRYEASQIVREQQQATQEAQAREMTIKQARDFANAYPEFKNPFTGEPDLVKVNNWLEGLSRTDWVTLKRALDGKPVSNGTPMPPPPPPEAEIARRANKPASVAGKSSETPLPPAKVSAELATISRLFGGNLVLPVDADI
jgi:hypothetical protein